MGGPVAGVVTVLGPGPVHAALVFITKLLVGSVDDLLVVFVRRFVKITGHHSVLLILEIEGLSLKLLCLHPLVLDEVRSFGECLAAVEAGTGGRVAVLSVPTTKTKTKN